MSRPDPLPPILPAGTRFTPRLGPGALREPRTTDRPLRLEPMGATGWYQGVFPDEVDWESYREIVK